MIFKYKCGHEGTEGFWKDDEIIVININCPKCKGKIVLKLKPKGEKDAKPSD